MALRRFVVTPVVAGGAGAATAYSPAIYGLIESIRYIKDDYADGSTFTITAETTGEGIWTETAVNASATRHPRGATHSIAGVASLYAGGGTAVNGKIALGGDRIKFAITNGGSDGASGAFHVIVDG